MLSTWHSNEHRNNRYLQTLWNQFDVFTRRHFYHVGAHEANRKPMLEALVTNYSPMTTGDIPPPKSKKQLVLFEKWNERSFYTADAAHGEPSA